MTSGQGQHGEDERQPPQWQPPGPPPYGQPPYGQPGPYGPPPYGYAPAPSPRSGPPPEPRERPVTVRAGLGAFVASFVLSFAGSILGWTDPQGSLRVPADPEFEEQTGIDPEVFAEAAQEGATIFSVVFSLVLVGVFLLFVWFAWRGHNWARIVLWVVAGLSLAFSPFTFGLLGQVLPASQIALLVFQLIAMLVGVVLLALKPSHEWYAYEKWRRAMTGPR